MKMPLRFYIIRILMDRKKGMTVKEIHDQVEKEYGHEGQCTMNAIDDHLMSMKGVGLVAIQDAVLDESDQLEVYFEFTDYGRTRAQKYIPEYLIKNN